MNKEQLLEFLRENLSLDLGQKTETLYDGDTYRVEVINTVQLVLDGEVISEVTF